MGATNELSRMAASIGILNGVAPSFKAVMDLPNGGALFALPALIECGVLRNVDTFFNLPKGYYTLENIFLLMSFMALCRYKTIESLRYHPPGEWGKLLGLDRIPEVRTLREKLKFLSQNGDVEKWSAQLCQDWMDGEPDNAGILYVDGHVRVYHGHQTKLPRHHVARQRLCLRATTDYWVNALDGQPFFRVTKPVDPGMLQVLRNDIVDRLKDIVPNQPSKDELEQNELLHRFTIIFDREGYSPAFMKEMKESCIAVITYNKHPKEDWHVEEFLPYTVTLTSGNEVTMLLAERGVKLSNELWVREVRKLNTSGTQTSILATDYINDLKLISVYMFGRWSQENYFKYMRENFNLDALITNGLDPISDTTKVVNPQHRELESKIRSKNGILNRKLIKLGSCTFTDEIEPHKVEKHMKAKTKLLEEVASNRNEIEQLKEKRSKLQKHIQFVQLPEEQKFKQLSTQSKHFIDTIKMIAYRAETAMANIIRPKMARNQDVRKALKAIYKSDADIIPDYENKVLNVYLHHQANKSEDNIIRTLCTELNETETVFPGTELKVTYSII